MEHKCQNPQCGKSFESKRNDAKYCSTACRVAVKRNPLGTSVAEASQQPTMSADTKIIDVAKQPKWVIDVEDYCNRNDITADDLIAFHKKYRPKIQSLGLDQKAITKPINEQANGKGSNNYLLQRRQMKLTGKS